MQAQKPTTAISQQPHPNPNQRRMPHWLTGRALPLSFGVILVLAAVVVAVVFPPLVPRSQRIEVFMMALAFALIGSGALFTGALPAHDPTAQTAVVRRPLAQTLSAQQRATLLRGRSGNRKGRAAFWGLGLGAIFLLAGLLAPFVLGAQTADERFLMMIGFAPIAVIGAIMLRLFWRGTHNAATASAPSSQKKDTAPAKPTVTHTPGSASYKIGMRLAIGFLLMLLVAVLVIVLGATLWPVFTRFS